MPAGRKIHVEGLIEGNTCKDNGIWDKEMKEEADLRRSLQGKTVAVLDHAEARYYERTKGKRCPYKVSG